MEVRGHADLLCHLLSILEHGGELRDDLDDHLVVLLDEGKVLSDLQGLIQELLEGAQGFLDVFTVGLLTVLVEHLEELGPQVLKLRL